MQQLNLKQGSTEWHTHRRSHFNASDAAAMMGCSPYKTRDQLLHEMHTGLTAEVDAHTQKRFDDGHRFEALARSLAEEIIGEELYPVVGVKGKLSASYDGLTMAGKKGFEHKSLNDELRKCFADIATVATEHQDKAAGTLLPRYHQIQLEHQHIVSEADFTLFMASKWEGETLIEEHHCAYYPNADLAQEILAGWDRFDIDLAAYVPPAATAPAPTGRAPETLPALFATVKGEVTASNLTEFKEVALTAIRSVNRDLKTDQDFADAEKAVKWCEDVESRVAGAKEHALSQTTTIDQLFKAYDDISAEARQVRLDLEKLVKARKVSLKTELLTDIQTQWGDYLRECNKLIGKDYMPQIQVDFAGAIHGKKNFDSMRSALNTALANGKIEASAKADLIQANVALLQARASEHKFLFAADITTLVLKATDDLDATITARISDHDKAEADKLEKQREAIRQEERAKAEKEARDKLLAEQEAAAPAPAAPLPVQTGAARQVQQIISQAQAAMPAQAPVAAVKPSSPPSLKLGEINARLQYMSITAAQLSALGFEPAAREKSAVLFHEHQYPQICAALIQKLHEVRELQTA